MLARLPRTTAYSDESFETVPHSIQSEIRDGVVHRVQRLTVKNGRLLVVSRNGAAASFAAGE